MDATDQSIFPSALRPVSSDSRPPTSDLGPRTSGPGFFLHASSVVIEDRALLFLGHSTAGKSTIARLLGEVAPVLADDSVHAFCGENGEWRVVDGGFRFADGGLSEWRASVRGRIRQGGVRLGTCLRLHKASETRLEPITPWQLARYLMDAAMEIDLQRKWGRAAGKKGATTSDWADSIALRMRWFGQAAEIARSLPGWHLWFSKEIAAVELGGILSGLIRR